MRTFQRDKLHIVLREDRKQQQISEVGMSKSPKVQLKRLPKRDAVARLRAVYACLERGWQEHHQVANRQTISKPKQEEG